jgi:hypothetical protein
MTTSLSAPVEPTVCLLSRAMLPQASGSAGTQPITQRGDCEMQNRCSHAAFERDHHRVGRPSDGFRQLLSRLRTYSPPWTRVPDCARTKPDFGSSDFGATLAAQKECGAS